MNKKLIIVVLGIISVSIVIYAYLGGYRSIEFKLGVEDLSIYGTTFSGPVKSIELGRIFNETKELAARKNTNLVVVDFPIQNKDSIKQLIGIISNDSVAPQSIKLKEVTFIKALLTAHPAVMPLPEDVKKEAAKFAADNDLKLDDFSLEIYYNNGDIELLYPTKAF